MINFAVTEEFSQIVDLYIFEDIRDRRSFFIKVVYNSL